MLTKKNIAVSGIAANTNLFDTALQLKGSNCSVQIDATATNAATKGVIKTSVTGANFSKPHDDAEFDIAAGSNSVALSFSGFTKGLFVELHFIKGAATAGTIDAALIG